MKVRIVCILLILSGFTRGPVWAQDVVFSQLFASYLHLNPAFAGAYEENAFRAGYRNQWPFMGNTYVDYYASYDQYLPFLQGAIGIMAERNTQGDGTFAQLNLGGGYAFHFALNRDWDVQMGIQAFYTQHTLDASRLVFGDGLNAGDGTYSGSLENIRNNRYAYPDFASGILLYSRNFYGGVAVHHLTAPKSSFGEEDARVYRRYTLHAGWHIPLRAVYLEREELRLSPNLIWIHQGAFDNLLYGIDAEYRKMMAGIWVRQLIDFRIPAIVLKAGYRDNNMGIGYSYDLNLMNANKTGINGGAHEVTFYYHFQYKPVKKKYRAIKCPKF